MFCENDSLKKHFKCCRARGLAFPNMSAANLQGMDNLIGLSGNRAINLEVRCARAIAGASSNCPVTCPLRVTLENTYFYLLSSAEKKGAKNFLTNVWLISLG